MAGGGSGAGSSAGDGIAVWSPGWPLLGRTSMLTPDAWSELSPPKVAVDFAAELAEEADIAARCRATVLKTSTADNLSSDRDSRADGHYHSTELPASRLRRHDHAAFCSQTLRTTIRTINHQQRHYTTGSTRQRWQHSSAMVALAPIQQISSMPRTASTPPAHRSPFRGGGAEPCGRLLKICTGKLPNRQRHLHR